jgi:hypothetical protein
MHSTARVGANPTVTAGTESTVNNFSFCRPPMFQAHRYQIGNIRLAYAHHRIRATPINLYRPIRLRNLR